MYTDLEQYEIDENEAYQISKILTKDYVLPKNINDITKKEKWLKEQFPLVNNPIDKRENLTQLCLLLFKYKHQCVEDYTILYLSLTCTRKLHYEDYITSFAVGIANVGLKYVMTFPSEIIKEALTDLQNSTIKIPETIFLLIKNKYPKEFSVKTNK